ncbi:MAG TPA: TauD/TfdA family dioxygenase [Planctomycetota bacterium]|nr:TauD/TfdA family dioxygenase [Planctomycetota bacterium]
MVSDGQNLIHDPMLDRMSFDSKVDSPRGEGLGRIEGVAPTETKIHIPTFTGYFGEIELRSAKADDVAAQVKEALGRTKVLRLVPGWHISELRTFYDRLVELIADPLDIGEDFKAGGRQTGEKWLEIRYDQDIPDLAAYRHSRNKQPLHTDESYISSPADVMLFYSVNRAAQGGATLFVDVAQLVQHLKEVDEDLFQAVTREVITYRKSDQARSARIIDISRLDPIVNYNFYCIDPAESEHHKNINNRFFVYLRDYVFGSYMCTEVALNPGEAVLWWDHFVIHGRNSFSTARSNDRFIWKTGMKWR